MPETVNGLIIADDTSRRKAASKASALQTAILKSANFSSIATDENGLIQLFNVGAERMLGYRADEVIDKITPAEIADASEVVARAKALSMELGRPIAAGFEALVFKASCGIEDNYELTYICKDGGRYPSLVSVTALRDELGTLIGYLLIGTDYRARKQAEEAVKLTILNSLVAEIAVVDLDGVIREVNEPWQRSALAADGAPQTTLRTVIGTNYLAIDLVDNEITRAEAQDARLGIQAVLEGRLPSFCMEYACHSPTQQRWFAMNVLPLGKPVRSGAVIAHTDITEYKRLEQVLQDKNVELESARFVAEKANQAKSDFLSSMSHELRSPLNAILGFAQLIESGTPVPTVAQKESIDQILQAGWYLLDLINEILDLALIESGKLSLSLEPMSLTEVLSDCQSMIEPQAQKSGIRITFPRVDSGFFVKADRTRVKQVLVNLLSNAIKYNRVGGSVEVRCHVVTPERIRISFQDTGQGLSAKKMSQLFQPFNRLGQEGGVQEGTGIGLAVSKRLVELMRGEIGVQSTEGVGSVFWVELNSTAASHLAAVAPELISAAQESLLANPHLHTLLCVEDNPANLRLVEKLLERRDDIHLLSARDGHRGIEIARACLPDVILMDINLPGISGITALKILSQDPLTAHIPVIALSANAMPLDIERGLEAGFFRYLTKPIKVTEFMATLDAALKFSHDQSALLMTTGTP